MNAARPFAPHRGVRVRRGLAAIALGSTLAVVLGGCAGETDAESKSSSTGSDGKTVTLIVHDSFPNDDFEKAASAATGYEVKVVAAGDGGELSNKLVLTKGAPVADAFFGVDTIFASRVVENDVVEPYTPKDLPEGASALAVDDSGALTPVDHGPTCINIDTQWFADHGLDEPKTYADLADPDYRDLTVLLDPTASSTGASFLAGTVEEFGEDGFADYWKSLVDNGARIEQGWSDAYYGQFSQGGEDGTKPIVVSYGSSPAVTLTEDGSSSTTKALLDTCSEQVEYAGVLAGAQNEKGAKAVVDYLVSKEFQQTIPDTMYMYPADSSVKMPDAWAKFAPLPADDQLHDLPAADIDAHREGWLKTLSDTIGL